jgi:hypothetical protein
MRDWISQRFPKGASAILPRRFLQLKRSSRGAIIGNRGRSGGARTEAVLYGLKTGWLDRQDELEEPSS